jgi:hypothetical protein
MARSTKPIRVCDCTVSGAIPKVLWHRSVSLDCHSLRNRIAQGQSDGQWRETFLAAKAVRGREDDSLPISLRIA